MNGALAYALRTPHPFAPGALSHWAGDVLLPLLLAGFVLAGAAALGRRVLARVAGAKDTPAWAPELSLALGLALVGTGVFWLGSAGLFQVDILRWLVLGLGALAAVDRRHSAFSLPRGRWAAAACLLLAYLAWSAGVRALAPPSDIDALKDHLALPSLYLASGRVECLPWLVFSHWPQLMEMLYGLGLAFGRDAVPALLHAGMCATLVVLTWRLAREESGPAAALAAACALAAQPDLVRQAGAAMTDGALALFYLLMWACLLRAREKGRDRWLALAGLLGGAAASVKLHGAVLLTGTAAWLVLRGRSRGDFARAAVFLGWAAAVAAPWYLKEWAASGNPVWPLLPRLFGGKWGAASLAPWYVIRTNWAFATRWILFDGEGAIFLAAPAAAAALWLARRRRLPPSAEMLAPALVFIPFAAHSPSIWRYLTPFYAPLVLLCARAFADAGPKVRAAGLAVALGGLSAAGAGNALFPLLGLRSSARPELSPRDAYLVRTVPGYEFLRAAGTLARGGRVLLITENRGYYVGGNYAFGDPSDQADVDYAALASPAELLRALRERGFAYVAVNSDESLSARTLAMMAPRSYALIGETLRRHADVVYADGPRAIYKLKF